VKANKATECYNSEFVSDIVHSMLETMTAEFQQSGNRHLKNGQIISKKSPFAFVRSRNHQISIKNR
jgi:hypothetical protein